MNAETFLRHWGVIDNPFKAEEAREDAVFHKLSTDRPQHPEFDKVFGNPDQPGAAVVFGEKGSGKTALRYLLEQRIARHNHEHPDRKVWVVRYDDLNPVLDRFAQSLGALGAKPIKWLNRLTLKDHMDAIISLSVTGLIDLLLAETDRKKPMQRAVRRMDYAQRLDLAELVICYDQPTSGTSDRRWEQMRRICRLGWVNHIKLGNWLGGWLILMAVMVAGYLWWTHGLNPDTWTWRQWLVALAGGSSLVLGFVGWSVMLYRGVRFWLTARRIVHDIRVVAGRPSRVCRALSWLKLDDLKSQPLPVHDDLDSRYQLIGRLLKILNQLDYVSLVVLMDRVDEPAMVNSDPALMKAIVWPMFNNKFLQQPGVGVKMLLPIELRHLLNQESAAFYEQARLDKQHMVDKLQWSGPMLYDVANQRLKACRSVTGDPVELIDLFADDVTMQDLIDALEQMQQPRDAFKFLYRVIEDHAASMTDTAVQWNIPRLTLEHVRKAQAQRMMELHRGLRPA